MDRDAFSVGVEPGGLHSHHEIKLLICYILASVNEPLTKTDISSVFTAHGMANYFDVNAALTELMTLSHVTESDNGNLFLEETGRHACKTLVNTLPYTLRERAVQAASRILARRKNERENRAEIRPTEKGYTVCCTIGQPEDPLLSFSMPVTDEWQAQQVRDRFYNDPLLFYQTFIGLVTGNAKRDRNNIIIDLK